MWATGIIHGVSTNYCSILQNALVFLLKPKQQQKNRKQKQIKKEAKTYLRPLTWWPSSFAPAHQGHTCLRPLPTGRGEVEHGARAGRHATTCLALPGQHNAGDRHPVAVWNPLTPPRPLSPSRSLALPLMAEAAMATAKNHRGQPPPRLSDVSPSFALSPSSSTSSQATGEAPHRHP